MKAKLVEAEKNIWLVIYAWQSNNGLTDHPSGMNSSSSYNSSVITYGQTDGSSVQTNYPDILSWDTNILTSTGYLEKLSDCLHTQIIGQTDAICPSSSQTDGPSSHCLIPSHSCTNQIFFSAPNRALVSQTNYRCIVCTGSSKKKDLSLYKWDNTVELLSSGHH